MKLLSEYLHFFETTGTFTIDEILEKISPSKVLASEYGWLFLANDTNKFLSFYFGTMRWTTQEHEDAHAVFAKRLQYFADRGIRYRKIIVPEKSVVYADYLPQPLVSPVSPNRPALALAADWPEKILYLADYLIDARSFGQIYFRGDTHTNWLGAWLVYRQSMNFLSATGIQGLTPLPLSALRPDLAGWEGDLWTKVSDDQAAEFASNWDFALPNYGFEVATSFALPEQNRVAWKIAVPDEYRKWFKSRETFVYERPDGQGLKAVIFRDSTMDLCVDLFAQHFSRSVFVWYQGKVVEEVVNREQPDIVIHAMAERFVSSYPYMEVSTKISEISDTVDEAAEVI